MDYGLWQECEFQVWLIAVDEELGRLAVEVQEFVLLSTGTSMLYNFYD